MVTILIALPLRGGRHSIVAGHPDSADHDTTLIAALRKAHAMVSRDERGQPMIHLLPLVWSKQRAMLGCQAPRARPCYR